MHDSKLQTTNDKHPGEEVKDLETLAEIAKEAGEAILEIYGTEFSVEKKADRSPLTEADTRSHQIISRALKAHYPEIPILSEEGKEIDYARRRKWSRFWLVDPLDGTKEFIKRNGEFTVNIALVEGHAPIWGMIYIPVRAVAYVANVNQGAWKIKDGKRQSLTVKRPLEGTVRVIKSRSHPSPQLEALLDLLPDHEVITRGSALKFCAVAAGEADFYPRFGPTWEWDTAAGQAIVTAAGGVVLDLKGKPLVYNKANLINGPFLVGSDLGWLTKKGLLERAAGFNLD
jgi:3'(2'), 5'-bisphosphate nucleotidase